MLQCDELFLFLLFYNFCLSNSIRLPVLIAGAGIEWLLCFPARKKLGRKFLTENFTLKVCILFSIFFTRKQLKMKRRKMGLKL